MNQKNIQDLKDAIASEKENQAYFEFWRDKYAKHAIRTQHKIVSLKRELYLKARTAK